MDLGSSLGDRWVDVLEEPHSPASSSSSLSGPTTASLMKAGGVSPACGEAAVASAGLYHSFALHRLPYGAFGGAWPVGAGAAAPDGDEGASVVYSGAGAGFVRTSGSAAAAATAATATAALGALSKPPWLLPCEFVLVNASEWRPSQRMPAATPSGELHDVPQQHGHFSDSNSSSDSEGEGGAVLHAERAVLVNTMQAGVLLLTNMRVVFLPLDADDGRACVQDHGYDCNRGEIEGASQLTHAGSGTDRIGGSVDAAATSAAFAGANNRLTQPQTEAAQEDEVFHRPGSGGESGGTDRWAQPSALGSVFYCVVDRVTRQQCSGQARRQVEVVAAAAAAKAGSAAAAVVRGEQWTRQLQITTKDGRVITFALLAEHHHISSPTFTHVLQRHLPKTLADLPALQPQLHPHPHSHSHALPSPHSHPHPLSDHGHHRQHAHHQKQRHAQPDQPLGVPDNTAIGVTSSSSQDAFAADRPRTSTSSTPQSAAPLALCSRTLSNVDGDAAATPPARALASAMGRASASVCVLELERVLASLPAGMRRQWRMSVVNAAYDMCPSYPSHLVLPTAFSDEEARQAAAFRARGRIPAFCWQHPGNGAVLSRSAQPLAGIVMNNRSEADEKLVRMLHGGAHTAMAASVTQAGMVGVVTTPDSTLPAFSSLPTSPRAAAASAAVAAAAAAAGIAGAGLDASASAAAAAAGGSIGLAGMGAVAGAVPVRSMVIADARPRKNALANGAMGGGCESSANYKCTEVVYLGIDNIHVVRDSLHRLRDFLDTHGAACSDGRSPFLRSGASGWTGGCTSASAAVAAALADTGWLQHVHTLLAGAAYIAALIAKEATSVLVHCSDGWDRTPSLVSLALLLLDPYYRTFDGFKALVEVHWASFGHQFAERLGVPGYVADSTSAECCCCCCCTATTHQQRHATCRGWSKGGSGVGGGRGCARGDAEDDLAFVGKASAGVGGSAPSSHHPNQCPVLLQWVDCVAQLLRLYPHHFEFTTAFLVGFVDGVMSCRFANFLANSEKERRAIQSNVCRRRRQAGRGTHPHGYDHARANVHGSFDAPVGNQTNSQTHAPSHSPAVAHEHTHMHMHASAVASSHTVPSRTSSQPCARTSTPTDLSAVSPTLSSALSCADDSFLITKLERRPSNGHKQYQKLDTQPRNLSRHDQHQQQQQQGYHAQQLQHHHSVPHIHNQHAQPTQQQHHPQQQLQGQQQQLQQHHRSASRSHHQHAQPEGHLHLNHPTHTDRRHASPHAHLHQHHHHPSYSSDSHQHQLHHAIHAHTHARNIPCIWSYLRSIRETSGHLNPLFSSPLSPSSSSPATLLPPPAALTPTLIPQLYLRWCCPDRQQGGGGLQQRHFMLSQQHQQQPLLAPQLPPAAIPLPISQTGDAVQQRYHPEKLAAAAAVAAGKVSFREDSVLAQLQQLGGQPCSSDVLLDTIRLLSSQLTAATQARVQERREREHLASQLAHTQAALADSQQAHSASAAEAKRWKRQVECITRALRAMGCECQVALQGGCKPTANSFGLCTNSAAYWRSSSTSPAHPSGGGADGAQSSEAAALTKASRSAKGSCSMLYPPGHLLSDAADDEGSRYRRCDRMERRELDGGVAAQSPARLSASSPTLSSLDGSLPCAGPLVVDDWVMPSTASAARLLHCASLASAPAACVPARNAAAWWPPTGEDPKPGLPLRESALTSCGAAANPGNGGGSRSSDGGSVGNGCGALPSREGDRMVVSLRMVQVNGFASQSSPRRGACVCLASLECTCGDEGGAGPSALEGSSCVAWRVSHAQGSCADAGGVGGRSRTGACPGDGDMPDSTGGRSRDPAGRKWQTEIDSSVGMCTGVSNMRSVTTSKSSSGNEYSCSGSQSHASVLVGLTADFDALGCSAITDYCGGAAKLSDKAHQHQFSAPAV